jgi:hypothetical protein
MFARLRDLEPGMWFRESPGGVALRFGGLARVASATPGRVRVLVTAGGVPYVANKTDQVIVVDWRAGSGRGRGVSAGGDGRGGRRARAAAGVRGRGGVGGGVASPWAVPLSTVVATSSDNDGAARADATADEAGAAGEGWLTGPQCAARIGVTPGTWRGLVRRGLAPGADDPGDLSKGVPARRPRWLASTLDGWKRAGRGHRSDKD